jgi:hypothetical protein
VEPMRLLQSGIPLSLLLDLVLGPESADLLAQERSAANGNLVRVPKPARHRTGQAVGTV